MIWKSQNPDRFNIGSGIFFAICQIKEAGQMPALPRNCMRNKTHLNATDFQNGDWEGVESRLSREPGDLSDGSNNNSDRGGKEIIMKKGTKKILIL